MVRLIFCLPFFRVDKELKVYESSDNYCVYVGQRFW